MNHYDLNTGMFGMAMWQPREKFDVIGDSVSMAALDELIAATEKDAEAVARDMLHAYLMEGGDPEVLLEDLRKFQESEKDE